MAKLLQSASIAHPNPTSTLPLTQLKWKVEAVALQFITITVHLQIMESIQLQVCDFRYDDSIMNQPEYCILTKVVLDRSQCCQWETWKTYDEFLAFDNELRNRFPDEMNPIPFVKPHKRRQLFRFDRTRTFMRKRKIELDQYVEKINPLDFRDFCNFDSRLLSNQRIPLDLNVKRRNIFMALIHECVSDSLIESFRHQIVQFGLFHATTIAATIEEAVDVIQLKKRLYSFDENTKAGLIEIRIACTLLNLRLQLVQDQHFIEPFQWFHTAISPQILILNSIQNRESFVAYNNTNLERTVCKNYKSEIVDVDVLSGKAARELQSSILKAVWDACEGNRWRFERFQSKAQEYGRTCLNARLFYEYLQQEFTNAGASYITDFLVHILPNDTKRRRLLQCRWTLTS